MGEFASLFWLRKTIEFDCKKVNEFDYRISSALDSLNPLYFLVGLKTNNYHLWDKCSIYVMNSWEFYVPPAVTQWGYMHDDGI